LKFETTNCALTNLADTFENFTLSLFLAILNTIKVTKIQWTRAVYKSLQI